MTNKTTIPAEHYGAAIADVFINQLFAAKDQASASHALTDALCKAFDHDHQEAIEAIAGGFAACLVNVLERGRDAIHADGPFVSDVDIEVGE